MAGIGTTSIYINESAISRPEFETYSTQLFDDWEAHVADILKLPDYSLALVVQEGSINIKAKILAGAGVLYIGIGQYGSFINGIQTIHSQVQAAGDYMVERAAEPFNTTPRVIRRGESLSRIKTLFEMVQRRELSVDEAILETEAIFGDELESVPEFVNDLRNALIEAPPYPLQTNLELVDSNGLPLKPETQKRKRIHSPKPNKPLPEPDQYRVEIWRENKRSKRNVRVIKLD